MRWRLLGVAALILFALNGWAGQPLFGSPEGVFYRWNNGVLNWINSGGDLAPGYSNEKGVAMVQEAFDIWSKAGLQNPAAGGFKSTATLQTAKQGSYAQSFSTDPKDAHYYLNYIKQTAAYPTIIFDKDGSIVKDLSAITGEDLSSVVAYTVISDQYLDSNSHAITYGVTILNGAMMNKGDINEARFKASVIHEIGHLLGLDHSGLNDTYSVNKNRNGPASAAGAEKGIPTMYPVNVSGDQANLHNDDSVAISTLYPTDEFSSQFCTITGNIVDAKGVGVQGLEVVAWAENPASSFADSLSTMTGVNFTVPTKDGHYYIRGIVPKRTYAVTFGTAPQFNSDGSGIGMFSKKDGVTPPVLGKPPISNAAEGICLKDDAGKPSDSCQITAAQGTVKSVSCDKGGQQIVMDTVKLDTVTVDAKYETAPTPTVNEPQPPPAAAASGKSGGCALIR